VVTSIVTALSRSPRQKERTAGLSYHARREREVGRPCRSLPIFYWHMCVLSEFREWREVEI
jgi:hypothetical protein